MDIKKFLIRDGLLALQKEENGNREVVICNVKKDQTGTYFNVRDIRSNSILKKHGFPIMYKAEYALNSGKIIIENPEYLDSDTGEVMVNIDESKEKREELRNFFLNNVKFNDKPFTLDNEQIEAILSESNSLIIARAGSGKTRVLVAKLLYLFEKKQLKENDVLAFCFNHDASVEISNRLNTQCKIDKELKFLKYDVAKTFHSFSLQSIARSGQVLVDKVKLIKIIINDLSRTDPSFLREVYQFFRRETLRIDRKDFKDDEAYYKYLRNSEYSTLNGEKVKSKQEKYIADFLFEHGIDYVYEKSFYPYKIDFVRSKLSAEEIERCKNFLEEKKETKPDFYLVEKKMVWEHWAVTGDEKENEIISFEKSVGNYYEYLKNKEWKKKFWSSYWRRGLSDHNKYNRSIKNITNFLQTTNKQFYLQERGYIEEKIKEILEKNGFVVNKLPEHVLQKKVWEKSIDGFTLLIEQFINKLQQNYFDCIDVFEEKMKKIEDEKTLKYYQLGYKIYKKYVEVLSSQNNQYPYEKYNDYKYDFNQIIYECSKIIKEGKLDESISSLKWILIDEYQDFSRLFDYLINSILERNKNIKLFCVGDDWQAINRFAGSDLKFFKNYCLNYNKAKIFNIRTNYRSENHIVNFANRFVNERTSIAGERPISYTLGSGICQEVDIVDLYIGKYDDEENVYLKYLQEDERHKIEKAKYLKYCAEIIKKNKDKKIMILNRGNLILGKELEDFNVALRKICSEFISLEDYNNNVFVKTVHKAKGEEADIVIVLNVIEGSFPVFNSNNNLFEIFGQNLSDSLEDEEKLYYVALTRAKHSLYVLYDSSKASNFILTKNHTKHLIVE